MRVGDVELAERGDIAGEPSVSDTTRSGLHNGADVVDSLIQRGKADATVRQPRAILSNLIRWANDSSL
jgi:hypothetical protein